MPYKDMKCAEDRDVRVDFHPKKDIPIVWDASQVLPDETFVYVKRGHLDLLEIMTAIPPDSPFNHNVVCICNDVSLTGVMFDKVSGMIAGTINKYTAEQRVDACRNSEIDIYAAFNFKPKKRSTIPYTHASACFIWISSVSNRMHVEIGWPINE